MDNFRMDRLVLNLQDVKDPQKLLGQILDVIKGTQDVVACGIYRVNMDMETDTPESSILVTNNQTKVLQGEESVV